jgi:hypothetical protein
VEVRVIHVRVIHGGEFRRHGAQLRERERREGERREGERRGRERGGREGRASNTGTIARALRGHGERGGLNGLGRAGGRVAGTCATAEGGSAPGASSTTSADPRARAAGRGGATHPSCPGAPPLRPGGSSEPNGTCFNGGREVGEREVEVAERGAGEGGIWPEPCCIAMNQRYLGVGQHVLEVAQHLPHRRASSTRGDAVRT